LEEVENVIQYEQALIDVIELEAQQRIFIELLKELGPEQQAVIKMKFFEHLDNEVIAGMLKKSEGAIRVIQHRALAKLKDLLKGRGIDNT
jgi:RNA polymerase sigma factor (sigma-70 family)